MEWSVTAVPPFRAFSKFAPVIVMLMTALVAVPDQEVPSIAASAAEPAFAAAASLYATALYAMYFSFEAVVPPASVTSVTLTFTISLYLPSISVLTVDQRTVCVLLILL